jgi:hypothetical protein
MIREILGNSAIIFAGYIGIAELIERARTLRFRTQAKDALRGDDADVARYWGGGDSKCPPPPSAGL